MGNGGAGESHIKAGKRVLGPSPAHGRSNTSVSPPCKMVSRSQLGELPRMSTPGLPTATVDTPLMRPAYKRNRDASPERHREHMDTASQPQSQPGPTDTPQTLQGGCKGLAALPYLVILSCPFACGSLGFVIFIAVFFLTCMEKDRTIRSSRRGPAPLGLILAQPPHGDAQCPIAEQ